MRLISFQITRHFFEYFIPRREGNFYISLLIFRNKLQSVKEAIECKKKMISLSIYSAYIDEETRFISSDIFYNVAVRKK